MRILMVADLRQDDIRGLTNNARKFAKGFLRLGHDVYTFSYRDLLLELSPIGSKRWAGKLAKDKTDALLTEVARQYQPDLVFVTGFRYLDGRTIERLRQAAAGALLVCWYGDMFDGVDPQVEPIAAQADWFLATSAGVTLRRYRALGPRCAFLPNPCDPDLEHRYPPETRYETLLMFTGKLAHGQGGQDPDRRQLLQTLLDRQLLTVYGQFGRPGVYGLDYYRAICSSAMALSINAFNDVQLYHSDRLTHYVGCGAFVLAKRVPDSDLLFQDGVHLRYFETVEQCLALIEQYRDDTAARVAIAEAGMAHAHATLHPARLAEAVLRLVREGVCDEPWAQVLA